MTFYDLVIKTRTIRRFQEDRRIEKTTLMELVELSRFGGSARNCQPFRYMLLTEKKDCDLVFPHLGWAGYLSDWAGPEEGERPVAYILCLLVKERCIGPEHEAHFDLGINTQNMLLGAAEKGIFGCRIASFSKELQTAQAIDDDHKLLLVLALGYPAEEVVLENMPDDGSVRYWRDAKGKHHVPKRSLQDIIYPVVDEEKSSRG